MSDWSDKTVKCQAVIKNWPCFPFKRSRRRKSVTFPKDWKSLNPSRAAVRKSCLALYKAYASPIWFKSAVGRPNSVELFIWKEACATGPSQQPLKHRLKKLLSMQPQRFKPQEKCGRSQREPTSPLEDFVCCFCCFVFFLIDTPHSSASCLHHSVRISTRNPQHRLTGTACSTTAPWLYSAAPLPVAQVPLPRSGACMNRENDNVLDFQRSQTC